MKVVAVVGDVSWQHLTKLCAWRRRLTFQRIAKQTTAPGLRLRFPQRCPLTSWPQPVVPICIVCICVC